MGNIFTVVFTGITNATGRGLNTKEVGLDGSYRVSQDDETAYFVHGIRQESTITQTCRLMGEHTTTRSSEIFLLLAKETDRKQHFSEMKGIPTVEISYEKFVATNPTMEHPSKELLNKYADNHWFL